MSVAGRPGRRATAPTAWQGGAWRGGERARRGGAGTVQAPACVRGAAPPATLPHRDRLGVQERPLRSDLLAEAGHPLRLDRRLARELEGERVDVPPVPLHAVVQVRAGGGARGADPADDLLLADVRPGPDGDAGEMAVERLEAVAVAELDGVAAVAEPAGALHRAVPDRPDRRAGGGAVVDGRVLLDEPLERVAAAPEAGGDLRVLERRAEEAALGALSVLVEVARLPVGGRVAEEPLPPGRRAVVLGGEHLAEPDEAVVGEDLLDHDAHPVAVADVLVEVHVPGEDVGGEDGEAGVLVGGLDRLVEAAVDRHRDAGDLGANAHLPLRRGEGAGGGALHEPLVDRALADREPVQRGLPG